MWSGRLERVEIRMPSKHTFAQRFFESLDQSRMDSAQSLNYAIAHSEADKKVGVGERRTDEWCQVFAKTWFNAQLASR